MQSCKLFVWEDGAPKPSLYFSIDVANAREELARDRRAIVTWLKGGLKPKEREIDDEGGPTPPKPGGTGRQLEDNGFYRFFEDVAKQADVPDAPRVVIPLTIVTKRLGIPESGDANGKKKEKKRERRTTAMVTTTDHILISTGFGTGADCLEATGDDVRRYKLCLVPFVAVAVHLTRDGKPLRAPLEGRCFAVLPTPVRTGGLPVHLEGRWELKVDRNNLVAALDATGADKVTRPSTQAPLGRLACVLFLRCREPPSILIALSLWFSAAST